MSGLMDEKVVQYQINIDLCSTDFRLHLKVEKAAWIVYSTTNTKLTNKISFKNVNMCKISYL